jgi:hypothetical protein
MYSPIPRTPYFPTEEDRKSSLCAAIIEPRNHKNLSRCVLQVCHKLDVPVHVFHGTDNVEACEVIQDEFPDHIELHNLGVPNLTIGDYNRIVYHNKSFFDRFDEDYVLIFQTDSWIMNKSDHDVTHFLGYSYIGAPWVWLDEKDHMYLAGNGGFSIRDVKEHREINEKYKARDPDVNWEDQHFGSYAKRLPSRDVAMQFSIESVYDPNVNPNPFGCHKMWNYLSNQNMRQIFHDHPDVINMVRDHGR